MLSNPADTPSLAPYQSLRAKALAATLALLAYLLACGAYIAYERAPLYDSVQALEALARHEKGLALVDASVNGALVEVNEISNAGIGLPGSPHDLRLYMEESNKLFEALSEFDPGYELLHRAIRRSYQALLADPQRANWIDLRESFARATAELEIRRARLADERGALTAAYQLGYDAVTVETLLLATVGLVSFGSLALWFFARLARDIQRLELHARRIVQGTRGIALPVERKDELGRLMHAVNRMAVDLDERERRITLDSQRRSHQDKMMAVAALAAGVAHEVNNPLAVIAGTAQALKDDAATASGPFAAAADTILAQAHRASQAARRLAEAAAPQPAERDWFDLRALVQRVVQWMGYDRRYRSVDIELRADGSLPAVYGSADVVQQVLMQWLPLVCEAGEGKSDRRSRVVIDIANNGAAVDVQIECPAAATLTPADAERNLLLANALLAPLQARLALAQHASGARHLKLSLPHDATSAAP